MTARRIPTPRARRASLLRAAMTRMVRARGRFRGALLARLAHGIGRSARAALPPRRRLAPLRGDVLFLPLNALSDLGLGQAGGGGGGSGRG